MENVTKQFPKRNAILAGLQRSKEHPSAETLYAQLKQEIPDLSMGTVYRNLALFKKQGLITGIATVDGVERFDGETHPHVHFICSECGAIMDLNDVEAPESLTHIAEASSGGEVTACQLSFTGRCKACISK